MKIPSKYQKLAAAAITLGFAAMITIVLGQGFQDSIPEVVWTMVNVNHLDLIFVSHAHRDHYQGITAIINAGITIKEVYFNIPDKTICDREIPWGCNYQEVLTYRKMLKERQVEVKSAQAGQAFDLGHDTVLKILYAFNGIQTPVGTTDINDMSLIMRLEHGQHKHLFTGDLNRAIGGYLADHPQEIAADVLKMPHHGTEGVAPNQFFEQVGAKYALVPSPSGLWCSDRSSRIRTWFREHKTPVFVNGFSGHVRVEDYGDQIKIVAEKDYNPDGCT